MLSAANAGLQLRKMFPVTSLGELRHHAELLFIYCGESLGESGFIFIFTNWVRPRLLSIVVSGTWRTQR